MIADLPLRQEIHFWKKTVAYATGNCANELFHWKSNPNVNSELGFGFSAFDCKYCRWKNENRIVVWKLRFSRNCQQNSEKIGNPEKSGKKNNLGKNLSPESASHPSVLM